MFLCVHRTLCPLASQRETANLWLLRAKFSSPIFWLTLSSCKCYADAQIAGTSQGWTFPRVVIVSILKRGDSMNSVLKMARAGKAIHVLGAAVGVLLFSLSLFSQGSAGRIVGT